MVTLPIGGTPYPADSGNIKAERTIMRLDTLKVPRASELVADRLRSLIVDGVVPQGATFPPEKDLVSQLGVSRATLREALRILEAEGLITTKTGPKGGIMVQRPGPAHLTKSLALLLQMEDTPLSMMLEARRMFEPLCASLAAERATSAELERLETTVQLMHTYIKDAERHILLQLEFHLGVVEAAHNHVLRLYFESIAEIISSRTSQVGLTPEECEQGTRAAEGILVALRAHDAKMATRRVEQHLRAFEQIVSKYDDK